MYIGIHGRHILEKRSRGLDVFECMEKRRSIRSFTDEIIDDSLVIEHVI